MHFTFFPTFHSLSFLFCYIKSYRKYYTAFRDLGRRGSSAVAVAAAFPGFPRLTLCTAESLLSENADGNLLSKGAAAGDGTEPKLRQAELHAELLVDYKHGPPIANVLGSVREQSGSEDLSVDDGQSVG